MSLGVRPMGFYCLPHFALLQLGVLFQRCMKKAAGIPTPCMIHFVLALARGTSMRLTDVSCVLHCGDTRFVDQHTNGLLRP